MGQYWLHDNHVIVGLIMIRILWLEVAVAVIGMYDIIELQTK